MTKKSNLQSEILYKDRAKIFHLDFDKIKRNYFLTKRNVKHSSLHTHAFFELELILSGKGKVKINGETYKIERGLVTVNLPADTHFMNAENEEGIVVWNFSFMGNILNKNYLQQLLYNPNPNVFYLEETEFQSLCNIYDLIYRETKDEKEFNDNLSALCIETMFTLILRNIATYDGKTRDSAVLNAIEYIHTHFDGDLSLNTVANKVGLNPSYLSAVFHEKTGNKYKDYILITRVNYAKKLISNFALSPTQACFEAGFNSYSSFLRAFEKIVKITPKQYYINSQNK